MFVSLAPCQFPFDGLHVSPSVCLCAYMCVPGYTYTAWLLSYALCLWWPLVRLAGSVYRPQEEELKQVLYALTAMLLCHFNSMLLLSYAYRCGFILHSTITSILYEMQGLLCRSLLGHCFHKRPRPTDMEISDSWTSLNRMSLTLSR